MLNSYKMVKNFRAFTIPSKSFQSFKFLWEIISLNYDNYNYKNFNVDYHSHN